MCNWQDCDWHADGRSPARTLRAARARSTGSSNLYTELAATIRASDLLQRRYGYYWTLITLCVLSWFAIAAGFLILGDSWFQLLLAAALGLLMTQFGFLGHDAGTSADLPHGRLERHDRADPGRRVRGVELRLVEDQAQPSPRRTQPGGPRPGHRPGYLRLHRRPDWRGAAACRAGSSATRAGSSFPC